MIWSLYRWTWQLESPLYVGMPPAGSLNRCRLHVPARAMWGAVTAELARATASRAFPVYQEVGDRIQKHVRFTYLFPADCTGARPCARTSWHAWLPRYAEKAGLVWQRENEADNELSDREFRMRLLSTRPSTAIEPSSDTAAEGSLRETEFLNTQWRSSDGLAGGPVGLVGYVFLHVDLQENVREALEQLTLITVGGDTRYGLGRLRRIEMRPAAEVFGCKVDLDKNDPEVETERVLAHVVGAEGLPPLLGALPELRGDMELLRGWDYGRSDYWRTERALWVPGSAGEAASVWRIRDSGHWSPAN